jgi:hypothetical protein
MPHIPLEKPIPNGRTYANSVCRAPGFDENRQAVKKTPMGRASQMRASPGIALARHGSREMLQTYEGGCHCGRLMGEPAELAHPLCRDARPLRSGAAAYGRTVVASIAESIALQARCR